MSANTFRDDLEPEGADVYRRRRLSVLTGVLVVVAGVVWACSSFDDGAERPVQRDGSSRSVAVAMAGRPQGAPAGVERGAVSPSPRPARPGRSRKPGDPCRRADLVLTLRGERRVYAGRGRPGFVLTLVNTGRLACTAKVGPRAPELRVRSGGDRIWSTADCVSGGGAERRLLERGVPLVRMIDWDRRRSGGDCRGEPAVARAGTYVAVARFGGLRSEEVVFHLR
jgi:hypothetical protein